MARLTKRKRILWWQGSSKAVSATYNELTKGIECMAEIENRTRVSLWLLRLWVYVAMGSSRRCGFQLESGAELTSRTPDVWQ